MYLVVPSCAYCILSFAHCILSFEVAYTDFGFDMKLGVKPAYKYEIRTIVCRLWADTRHKAINNLSEDITSQYFA